MVTAVLGFIEQVIKAIQNTVIIHQPSPSHQAQRYLSAYNYAKHNAFVLYVVIDVPVDFC